MSRHFLVSVGSLTGSKMFILLSQILVLPIIARYVGVADFGDMALAITVVLFTQLLSDAGLGRSLIRKEKFDNTEWSSVFWFLVLIGVALTAALLLVAPVWAWLFDRPRLQGLVSSLAILPFLLAISAVPTAWMERNNEFPKIALIRTVAALAAMFACIAFAILGAGVWALVAQQLFLAFIQCGATLAFSGYRPRAPRNRVRLGDHLTFARNSLLVSFLYTIQRQIPVLLIGYAHSPAALGLFTMSQRILNLPQMGLAGPVAQVAFVRMSAAQSTPANVAKIYLASMQLLAFIVVPPMAVLAGAGETAFTLLLSEPWRDAAIIFALSAPGIALETSVSNAGVLFQSMNRTELRLRMVFERTVLRFVCVLAALPFGVEGVAVAISVSALLFLPRLWHHVGAVVPFETLAAVKVLVLPFTIGIALWAASAWIDSTTNGWATLGWLLLLLSGTCCFIALAMHHRIREAMETFSIQG